MKNNMLTLSIVIPVYNDKNHLVRCLDSIAVQSVKPDSVIVVDNNSTDDSIKIARTYPFVKIITEKHQGVVHARNTGFNVVTTDIIGRIDSDSLLPINWVAHIKEFFLDKQYHYHAFTGGSYFYNIRLPYVMGWWQTQIAFRLNRLLLGHNIMLGSNMAITKDQWQAVKKITCTNPGVHEDLDLAIHLDALGYKIVFDKKFMVGTAMKRVRSNRRELWDNMMWWPKTLKHHNKKTWVFGWIGAVLLFSLSPFVPLSEYVAQFLGKKPIKD